MGGVSRLYLDTNVLIAIGEGSGQIPALLYDLIQTLKVDEQFLFTSELSLAELLVVPHRQRNEDLIRLYDNWIQPDGWLITSPVTRQVLWGAALIRADHQTIKLPDAIHISTAFAFRCSHFLTAEHRLPSKIELPHRWDDPVAGDPSIEKLLLSAGNLSEIIAGRQA